MAEIKIEKKSPIWPWILLLLGIIAAAYLLFFYEDHSETNNVVENEVEMVQDETETNDNQDAYAVDTGLNQEADKSISEYRDYLATHAEMGINHEYSHNALDHLIRATDAVAASFNVDIEADLAMAKEQAGSITDDPYEVDHADKIKKVGQTVVQALKKIQMQHFPDLQAASDELENTVSEIKPGTQTLEQKTAVKNFLNEAAELLSNMKNK